MTKTCFKCGEDKPLNEFYRHPEMSDGRLGKCKDCTKRDVRENYRARRDQYREYDRRRAQTDARKVMAAEYDRHGRARYPEKRAARQAVHNAIRDGRLVREPCERCGTMDGVQGHHDDYSRPLDVRWLCVPCHFAEHGRSVVAPAVWAREAV